jgi:hypothetical protein
MKVSSTYGVVGALGAAAVVLTAMSVVAGVQHSGPWWPPVLGAVVTGLLVWVMLRMVGVGRGGESESAQPGDADQVSARSRTLGWLAAVAGVGVALMVTVWLLLR